MTFFSSFVYQKIKYRIIKFLKFSILTFSIENICTRQDHCFASVNDECLLMLALKKYIREFYELKQIFYIQNCFGKIQN